MAGAFSFSEFSPLPTKLVAKIRKGDYVDMAELLRDNIEAERRRRQGEGDSSTNSSGSGSNKPPRHEVPDVLSWCQCFGIYVGVIATKQPEWVSQMLA